MIDLLVPSIESFSMGQLLALRGIILHAGTLKEAGQEQHRSRPIYLIRIISVVGTLMLIFLDEVCVTF